MHGVKLGSGKKAKIFFSIGALGLLIVISECKDLENSAEVY